LRGLASRLRGERGLQVALAQPLDAEPGRSRGELLRVVQRALLDLPLEDGGDREAEDDQDRERHEAELSEQGESQAAGAHLISSAGALRG
jgi:hypothetical protein